MIFFEQPAKGLGSMLPGPRRIDLPASDSNVVVTSLAIVPHDLELIGITAQAQWLCREMKVEAANAAWQGQAL